MYSRAKATAKTRFCIISEFNYRKIKQATTKKMTRIHMIQAKYNDKTETYYLMVVSNGRT